jgi:hypothetical protein
VSSIEPILYAAGTAIRAIAVQLGHVLAYPLDPTQRIYFVYLLSSLALAAWVYRRSRRDSAPAGDGGSFLVATFGLARRPLFLLPSAAAAADLRRIPGRRHRLLQ